MKVFENAGARILPNACGICAGYGADRLGENVTCISSTARNFKGRMGATSSKVWLASPYTVAASAVAGHIADPREFLRAGEGA
jgi:3-isopropylmalate/(R)-2-methylmalate dehydratase large subunit